MRILMLSQFIPPTIGGEERHVKTLSEALVARGHDVSIATLRHPGQPPFELVAGVKIYRIQGTLQRSQALFSEENRRHAPPFPDPELSANIYRVLSHEQPEIVHAHNWLVHSFLPLKPLTPAKLVITLHDYGSVCPKKNMIYNGGPCSGPKAFKCMTCAGQHFGRAKGAVTWLANSASSRLALALADCFIAVSRAVADTCRLEDLAVPFEIIPVFISDRVGEVAPAAPEQISLLPQDGYLLFVGDLCRLKGVHVLLEAYEQLRDPPPLVLIGRRCRDTPETLPSNVHLFESWPHPAVIEAWRRCLFGLAPSIFLETCGTVVMEANACGKPVVACRTGGLGDTVPDGKTGILVPPGDASALRDAMQRMIDDRPLRERLGAAAKLHANSFMTKAIVPRIEAVYASVLEPKCSSLRVRCE